MFLKALLCLIKDRALFINLPRRICLFYFSFFFSNIFVNSKSIIRELTEVRNNHGADIARQLRFPASVSKGIQFLDEHWDGSGHPLGAGGDDIPAEARADMSAGIAAFYEYNNTAKTEPFKVDMDHVFERFPELEGELQEMEEWAADQEWGDSNFRPAFG